MKTNGVETANGFETAGGTDTVDAATQTVPIADVRFRERANVCGRIRSLRVRPWGDSPTLEVVLVDETGGITLVFLARRHLAGIRPGTIMRAEGMVGAHQRRLAMLNPVYELHHVPASH